MIDTRKYFDPTFEGLGLRRNYYNSKVIAAVYEFQDNRVYVEGEK